MFQPTQRLIVACLVLSAMFAPATAAEREDVRKAINLVTSVKMPFPENLARNRAKTERVWLEREGATVGCIRIEDRRWCYEHIPPTGNRAEMLRIRNEPSRGVYIDAQQQDQRVTVHAGAAIVALPFGVLERPARARGAVAFEPALDAKREAFAGLESGAVLKVILKFRDAFWEELDNGRYKDAAFFHAPGAPFPTFWSALPVRAPLLCAWCAGPSAARMSGLAESTIVRRALDGVRTVFGARAGVARRLQASFVHDWQTDPFARGAYCYVTVGGRDARKHLAEPLGGTLFFAGEAAATGGESGTVAGALQSGERAAEQWLALRGRRHSSARGR